MYGFVSSFPFLAGLGLGADWGMAVGRRRLDSYMNDTYS